MCIYTTCESTCNKFGVGLGPEINVGLGIESGPQLSSCSMAACASAALGYGCSQTEAHPRVSGMAQAEDDGEGADVGCLKGMVSTAPTQNP